MRLHDYWRSGTSYRTRIALNLKGLSYERVTRDLRAGEQGSDDYRALSPQGLVPALETNDGALIQSPAILEWLEERHPEPPLLPADAAGRAAVRAMAAVIGCDIHPLNNLRVLQALKGLGADEAARDGWARRWIAEGLAALEALARPGPFLWGGAPTLADCYLVPQLYSARRFEADLALYPRLLAADAAMCALPAVAAAHPDRQPDADG